MSESLGPGSTFAGCRLEAVAGRGGMGVVYRATQLALGRPVALKAIAPELAADDAFRERFQRESHLAASIDHPNVIPVYEAGEFDGTLYLIMRWVEGTDLRTLLEASRRLSPRRAVRLLRPVASALAAAHRRGLVHRDVKPANVLVARGDEEDDDHVYLTDFGIARQTGAQSVTRTGVFVGTVDYTAPERFQGGRGDAAADVYSLGCVLFEALTGHVPYDRPSSVSKIYAHVTDPIPSARDEIPEMPRQLDAIIARAMAKNPAERFTSAAELAAALGAVLNALEPTEPSAAEPPPQPNVTELVSPTAVSEGAATQLGSEATLVEPPSTTFEPLPSGVDRPPATGERPPIWRRSALLWAAPIIAIALAVVLIATISDNHTQGGGSAASSPGAIKLNGSGLTLGRTFGVASTPAGVSVGSKNVWVSLPDRGELVRTSLRSGAQSVFPSPGRPTVLAAGTRALWVGQSASRTLAQFNGDSGQQTHAVTLSGDPVAIALDATDSSAWVTDSSGAIRHVAVGGTVIGTPAHSAPPATSIARGEGWLWATNGSPNGLRRVNPDTSGSSSAFRAGQRPRAVTLNNGVWIANADGHVTRFDPRAGQLRVNAERAIAPELDAIAATDRTPFVWAMSRSQKTVYRITNTSTAAVSGSIVFGSEPVALAVTANAVWVATQDRKVTEILF